MSMKLNLVDSLSQIMRDNFYSMFYSLMQNKLKEVRIRAIDDWLLALDQGFEVCVVFFDISKAFDTVPHVDLLKK